MRYLRKSPLGVPEINVVIFGFLLNFVWEMLQAPLFEGMKEKQHWEAVRACTVATFGDIAILLVAYWLVATSWGRGWILSTNRTVAVAFTCIGLIVSVAVEIVMT